MNPRPVTAPVRHKKGRPPRSPEGSRGSFTFHHCRRFSKMSGNVETGASLTGVKNETPLMKTPSVVYGPSQYELLGQCWTLCKPFARVKGDRHCLVDGTDGFGCGRPRLLEEG